MTPPPTPDPVVGSVAFVRMLRQAGVPVSVDAAVTYAAALAVVDVAAADDVFWVGRATLVRRAEDHDTYAAVFAAFFGGVPISARGATPEPLTLAIDDPDVDGLDGDEHLDGSRQVTVRFSSAETLRHADFATLSDDERAEAWRLIDQLRVTGASRPARRRHRTLRSSGPVDLGATVAEALRTDGEAIRRRHTRAGTRHRAVVLLVDVSGSMEPYARALLRFAHAATTARRRVEVFSLGTQLHRLTRELDRRDPDDALARAAAVIHDYSGGTRLGDGLRAFNDEWGVRGMARGAIVVILSDGWDRGDPAAMSEQMARLARVAHRIVWVNPLKHTAGYAPLARGMAAALPYCDEFVDGHSVESLERLAAVVAGHAPTRRPA